MQFQGFIPTLLLFNMILQSCHNPDLKLECDEAPQYSPKEKKIEKKKTWQENCQNRPIFVGKNKKSLGKKNLEE
jgi:hypothetical protein